MKFSIRDVLWLTALVALAVCWGIDRVRIQRDATRNEMRAVEEAEAARKAEALARYAAELARAQAAMGAAENATP